MENKEKRVIEQYVPTQLVWEKKHAIETVEKELNRLKSLSATHIEFDSYIEFGDPTLEVTASYQGEETDEQYNERVNGASIAEKIMEERELALLKKLKEKYENQ
jgi:hypothetical protein